MQNNQLEYFLKKVPTLIPPYIKKYLVLLTLLKLVYAIDYFLQFPCIEIAVYSLLSNSTH